MHQTHRVRSVCRHRGSEIPAAVHRPASIQSVGITPRQSTLAARTGLASWTGWRRAGALLLAYLCLALAAQAAWAKKGGRKADKERQAAVALLSAEYQAFVDEVQLLISDEELDLFLELEQDYQRDAFIDRFWKVRDRDRRTARNEFRDEWKARREEARQIFGSFEDERSRILLLNGFPIQRLELDCAQLVPIEIWWYEGSDQVGYEFYLLFYKAWGKGFYRLWEPFDGVDQLINQIGAATPGRANIYRVAQACGQEGEALIAVLGWIDAQGGAFGAATMLARIRKEPDAPAEEWLDTFSSYSTELPESAETFDAQLAVDYPGRHQSRTVVQATVSAASSDLGRAELGGAINLLLNGEILREGKLFESFRYRYDLPPPSEDSANVPVVMQRYLRPGNYQLIVKLEDLNGGRYHRAVRDIEVPKLDGAVPPPPSDPLTAQLLKEANAAIRNGESTLQLIPPQGEWQTGLVRLNTLITGDQVASATFFLDGRPVLTKRRPPFSVELDLGPVPRGRVLRVEGYDQGGEEITSDEISLNTGKHRFAVRLVEPRVGKAYERSIRTVVEVTVPEKEKVDRVEIFLNETRIAALYQPPYIQPVVLPEPGAAGYVRAVAYTPDGNSAEDTVFVNFPGYVEDVDVDLVEVYATVLDKERRPVDDLEQSAFLVKEDDVPQELTRFEHVRNLPIHMAVMLDVSASMEEGERLDQARAAAMRFFQQAITPKDRATIVTFNDHPNLAAAFTNDLDELAAGLSGLKAERGTALYDSLVFTLYYFNGITGQRAILLLSDGKDESSRFDFDATLDYARRAGVAMYTIGLGLKRKDLDIRRKLNRLAEETGGRSFFVEEGSELGAIYETIQRELRSRYLLAYQSSNTSNGKDFRKVEVEVEEAAEIKAMRGYFP